MMNQTDKTVRKLDPVINQFVTELRRQLGSHIRQLVLFGSRARGDEREGADYDMLVVVDHRTSEPRAKILNIEGQLMEQYGALVATVLRSEKEWRQTQGFPLAQNIAKEGVTL